MSVHIIDRTEGKRGCGYRKKGGMYLVSGGIGRPCGKLPIPLTVCPCCSQGIKPSRGWTWVDADKLTEGAKCTAAERDCILCPMSEAMGRAGLLWIGEKFYPTPGEFSAEAVRMGVSRRLSQVPRDFKVGETWILLAHRKCIPTMTGANEKDGHGFTPGVFHLFIPTAIEYVVTDQEPPEELERLAARGFTLVRVHRDDGKPTLAKGESEDDGD